MAIALTDLRQIYSSTTALALDRRPIIPQLLDRSWDADIAAGGVAKIPVVDFNATATDYTRGNDYKTKLTSGITYQDMTLDQAKEVGNEVQYTDPDRLPVTLLEGLRASQTRSLATAVEDNLATYLTADNSSNIDYAAANKLTRGATANHLNINGTITEATAGTVRAYVRQQIDDFVELMVTRNAAGEASEPTRLGATVGPAAMWCVLPPKLMRLFLDDLKAEKIPLDILNDDLHRNAAVFSTSLYKGQYSGVEMFATSAITVPTGTNDWKFVMGMPQAVAYSPGRPVVGIWPPGEYQSGPKWALTQVVPFARQLVNASILILGAIKSA